jgi:glycosyltransferase involved in cell wall biosynthesis
MRVLRIIQSLDPAHGGPSATMGPINEAMASFGYEVEVVCFDNFEDPWLNRISYTVHCLGSGTNAFHQLRTLRKFLQARFGTYDCVIAHGIWGVTDHAVWRGLRHTSTPYIVVLHGMLTPWFNQRYPHKYFKKFFYWFAYQNRILSSAKAVLYFCEEERKMGRQSFWPYNCNDKVIRYGTSQPPKESGSKRQFYNRFPHLINKNFILYLGRIHYTKGCDILIDAFARLIPQMPDAHLVMAGPDQVGWKDALMKRAAELGVSPEISWTGMLVGDIKWGALHASDAFVLPSHHDNHSVAMVEALGCGVPVLITDKVLVWPEIVEGASGFVAPDTVEGIHQILLQWYSLNAGEKALMRNSALKTFKERFDATAAAHSLIEVIENN